ncbi:sialidase family protein [Echinicola pacifica]|nr:sialidase family protein [Echinicola pacifica]
MLHSIPFLTTLFFIYSMGSTATFSQEHHGGPDSNTVSLFYSGQEEGVVCYRIPALVTARNGHLIAAIDQRVPNCGDLKYSKDINIVIRRSLDNGKTWLPIEKIVDFPYGQSASDPSMVVDQQRGTIFLFYNYMDLDKAKDRYFFHMIKSEDHGETWSAPEDLTEQLSLDGWENDFKFITSGRAYQSPEGTILHTIVNLEKGGFVFGSEDHGMSWFVKPRAIQPFDESKIISLADGSWMINSRVNGAGYRYQHVSTDKGETWTTSKLTQLTDPSCNASLITYTTSAGEELLLFSNLNDAKERKNLQIRVSKDGGRSWPIVKTVYEGAAAYSSMTILGNGDLGIFYESDDYSINRFTSYPMSWLME